MNQFLELHSFELVKVDGCAAGGCCDDLGAEGRSMDVQITTPALVQQLHHHLQKQYQGDAHHHYHHLECGATEHIDFT